MSSASVALDTKLQICFGVFAVLSLAVAIANLHPRQLSGGYMVPIRTSSFDESDWNCIGP